MPELPEVETIVRELISSDLIGKQIASAYVYWARIVETPSSEQLIRQLQNQRIQKVERRGKYLVFTLSSNETLLVHLRMTGKFEWIEKNAPVNKHEHVRLVFTDGTALRYQDPRKFGRWSLFEDVSEKMDKLGLEPLSSEFTAQALTRLLQNHSSRIKPFLLDQKYIAGLGNIYVDEALWEAKIHPQRQADSLTIQEIKRLHAAIQKVLNKGIKNQGTSLGTGQGNYFSVSGRRGGHQHQLKVFRQDGQACPRCGNAIVKIVVAQRGTHFCPICQKEA